MKLPQLKNGQWNYLLLAFAMPAAGMMVLLMIVGCTPFGDYSLLYSDMYHQYFPFFKEFRATLLSGESLLFNWSVGMGMDYLGLIAYYLASPLNLLSILMPEAWVLPYFSFLMPIKLGLAGLFFAIFLKKTFGKDDLSLPLFGCFYATCAWALGYQWNIMWLDTFALLPLVALGTVSLLRDKKFVLYTVALFFSILANYYIGFFTCIFVLLVFICYQICRWTSFKRFFLDLCRIALFSILAIGMTAILELPALAALKKTYASVNQFPNGFQLNIADQNTWLGLLDAMRQVAGNMNGGISPAFVEGLPNIYCGVGTIILAFLFLTSPKVKIRDKICSVVMLLFFMASYIIRQLDYIWHGFHFTNQIPYRFSFLQCFIMLYMAYRAFLMRRQFQLWQIIASGFFALSIIFCSESLRMPVFIAYNSIFFLLYIGIFIYSRWSNPIPKEASKEEIRNICVARKTRRRCANVLLAAVMGIELIMNIVNFGVNFGYTHIGDYPHGTENTASMIRYMKERDDELFYRTEVTHTHHLNEGALNGYHGISTFTSSANVKVTEFTKSLGLSAVNYYNRYLYEETSPVANLFLGLKYMLERDAQLESNPYFDEVWHSGNVYLLENNAYLPLGFLAGADLAQLEFGTYASSFIFQNSLFSAATGLTENVWNTTPPKWLTIDSEDVEIVSKISNGYCSYQAGDTAGTLKYTYKIQRSGFMCLDLTMSAQNNYKVWKNSVQLYDEGISLPQTIAVSQVEPGDVIEVHVTCKAGEKNSVTIKAGLLDDEVFRKGYDILNASTLELTSFANTNIEGTIHCNRDGLLYTSIPQDGNWVAFVDGCEVETKLVGDAMLALDLEEGTHTVQFIYQNKAFSLGWKISLGCLAAFITITFFVYYYPQIKQKGKYESK